MAKKNPKTPNKIVTPIRISIAINVVLGLIIVGSVAAGLYARDRYIKGDQVAAGFAAAHMYDYCDMTYRNLDDWLASDKSNNYTAKQIQYIKLHDDLACARGDFEPFILKASKDYFKSKGVPFDPPDGSPYLVQ